MLHNPKITQQLIQGGVSFISAGQAVPRDYSEDDKWIKAAAIRLKIAVETEIEDNDQGYFTDVEEAQIDIVTGSYNALFDAMTISEHIYGDTIIIVPLNLPDGLLDDFIVWARYTKYKDYSLVIMGTAQTTPFKYADVETEDLDGSASGQAGDGGYGSGKYATYLNQYEV